MERARQLIEQAEAVGEPPEDPLLFFSVLFGFWVTNYVAFHGDVMRELAAQFLALAEKQGATGPLITGQADMGTSLLCTGDIAQKPGTFRSRDRAVRSCRAPSAGDAIWARRPGDTIVLSVVGSVDARLPRGRAGRRKRRTQGCARDRPSCHVDVCAASRVVYPYPMRNYAAANAEVDEAVALADEKGALFWKPAGMVQQGCVLAAYQQGLEGSRHDHLRDQRMAANRSNIMDAVAHVVFDKSVCGTR